MSAAKITASSRKLSRKESVSACLVTVSGDHCLRLVQGLLLARARRHDMLLQTGEHLPVSWIARRYMSNERRLVRTAVAG